MKKIKESIVDGNFTHPSERPPASDLRRAFKAGFCAHSDREHGKPWVFDADTCAAGNMEAEAYRAWLASQEK